MYIPITIFALWILYLLSAHSASRSHLKNMNDFQHRVHVNGIRGKSSVTRLIAASLREGGIKTIGKTTGTSAQIIVNHRKDIPIKRKEADIAEQKKILNQYMDKGYDAAVFECMAINPLYQEYLENKIMKSTIGVITNIREDHVDMLGSSLTEIAQSLCATIPVNGHLVTAETNPELLRILELECEKRNTKMHAVGSMRIAEKHMSKFRHFEYRENVAIAIKVAQLAGIERSVALAGMQKAKPDPGSFKLQDIKRKQRTIYWANLFAINDRESFVLTTNTLSSKVGQNTKKVIILNNRHDRPERVSQFVDIALNSVQAEYIVTFGDYEKQVQRELTKQKARNVKLIHLGNSSAYKNANGRELMDGMLKNIHEKDFLLFGAVNIHSRQSRSLLRLMEGSNDH